MDTTLGRDGAYRILLVDDDEAFAELVARYLDSEHGFEVVIETSAEQALDRLDGEGSLSCVISDYAMPGMDGLEFLEEVSAAYPDLPFVMFAGQGSEKVASRAIRLGADDYLEKDTGETRYELLARRIDYCVTITHQQEQLQEIYDAIENAGHAMFVTDVDGTITYANPTMSDVSGYAQEEIIGSSPDIFKSDEHDEAFYEELWATILDGDVWQGEVINEHKKGYDYVIDQTISPISNNGEITGFVAINRDITVRKRRERNLAFFQQAVDQVGTGIAAYDPDGTILYANHAYAGMVGTDKETLTGESITVVNPELDRNQFDEYWDSFAHGESRRREATHQRFDTGEEFPVETVTTHIQVDDDEYHVGTIQDITERKERERKLQLFRKAVEQAGHSVLVTDDEGRIEYVNPAFEALTEYDREDVVGETPAILSSGEHDEEFYEELWNTIDAGEVWQGEVVNQRKSGEEYVVDQTIAPVENDEGEISHFVGINRDVTELKEQRRELQRQNERLEQFGRTVAHDLRNPLNVMDVHLGRARRAENPTEAHEEIQRAIDQMAELIDDLLALAKQGKTVLDPEPTDFESLATTAWENVDTRGMSLDIDGNGTFLMDESRVREVFENLFRNAREHAGETATVSVGTLRDGFFVEDDGPGIPDEELHQVLKSGFTTSEEGTGFGLAIVNQIAEAHDWDVDVTNGTEGGARFEFHGVHGSE